MMTIITPRTVASSPSHADAIARRRTSTTSSTRRSPSSQDPSSASTSRTSWGCSRSSSRTSRSVPNAQTNSACRSSKLMYRGAAQAVLVSRAQDLQPNVYVTYNGDNFDWPFVEARAKHRRVAKHTVLRYAAPPATVVELSARCTGASEPPPHVHAGRDRDALQRGQARARSPLAPPHSRHRAD